MTLPIKKSNLRIIVVSVVFVIYLVVGALLFSVIENPREQNEVKLLRNVRQQFLDNNKCLTEAELEDFIREVINANNRGVSALRNVTIEPNWSFGQSFFFAGTILTTIGYGHVAPLSDGGKAFCIVFALIGIPLTLILITATVERMLLLTKILQEGLHVRLTHLYQPFIIRFIHLTIIIIVIVTLIFIVPSAIFASIEKDWDYHDALYYCFISLTTIGLGDYIPGDHPDQKNRTVYKVATTFYLFIGLVCMMLLIAVVYQNPELNLGHYLSLKSDEESKLNQERIRLRTMPSSGPNYTQHTDEISPDSVATSFTTMQDNIGPNGRATNNGAVPAS